MERRFESNRVDGDEMPPIAVAGVVFRTVGIGIAIVTALMVAINLIS